MESTFAITRRRVVIVLVLSCWVVVATSWSIAHTLSVSVSTLRNVPTSITVSSVVLQLQAEAWRDFMPISRTATDPPGAPDGGRPMMVSFQLTHHGQRPSRPLHARTVWLVQGNSVWEWSTIEQSSEALDGLRMRVRGGPYWSPRSYLDVVVRFADDQGKTFDLAVHNQLLQAIS